MNVYEVLEIEHGGFNGLRHIAYVGGKRNTVDYVLSCVEQRALAVWYEKNGEKKCVEDCINFANNEYKPLTKKVILELLDEYKEISVYGWRCGGYYRHGFLVRKLQIEK